MPSTHGLISRLRIDYPQLRFASGSTMMWEPQTQTVYYRKGCTNAELLHELGHALLGHAEYARDIILLEHERDAWSQAVKLASQYGVTISEDTIGDHLDTYRDWLHTRSICPSCQANGIQVEANVYECPACQSRWCVNEARSCALRRRQIK